SLCMLGGTFAGLAGCNKGNGNGDGGDNPPPPGHTHSYTNWHDNGDGTHSPECSGKSDPECDAPVKTSEKENHVYDNDNDTDCNKCGYVRTISSGEVTSTPLPAGNKIYVVGDSTVCDYTLSPQSGLDNYFLPRYGYGTQIAEYFNVTSEQVVNLAASGRSSKSFISEPNYTTLTGSIKEGDYLIIGFGHNDQKAGATFTDPEGLLTQETTAKGPSLKYTFNHYYIEMAKAKGATPILCTPIVRYDDKGAYPDERVHITSDGNYPQAIRELGTETDTTVIDLTAITEAKYKADNAAAQYYHAHTSYKEEKPATLTGNETPMGLDKTHINKFGAKMVAYEIAKALKSTDCDLKAHIKESITAPTKADDYKDAVNMNFVKPDYKAFVPADYASRNLTGDWYHTVMGNIGGKKASTYNISYDAANQKFVVANPVVTNSTDPTKLTSGNNGKIDGSGDGFGAVFMQIEKSKNFTASAQVKVNAIGTDKPNQSAFGMMLRDDIHIDGVPAETYTGKEVINSNYVAAGIFGATNGAIFSRASATLTMNKNSLTPEVGSTYTVSIEKKEYTYTVKVGNYTQTYTDFDFFSVDNDYMYLCLFANRGLEVEFSNVQFAITGTASEQ
ncbi:MAG: hypothetical protein K2N50_01920, partial [Clostridia bacterium]|nr:hypothetical protein [Clostridia bacterium]